MAEIKMLVKSQFLNQVSNDSGSNININVQGDLNVIVDKTIDSLEGNAAQNNIAKYKERLLEEEPYEKHKQVFYWASASFANYTGVDSDKGVIEELDCKPHKVIFEREIDKQEMTKFNVKLNKEWQDLLYIIDVRIIIELCVFG